MGTPFASPRIAITNLHQAWQQWKLFSATPILLSSFSFSFSFFSFPTLRHLSETQPNPFRIYQKPNKTMENLSDTYHDPSYKVPKNYYWNADPPNFLKKIYIQGGFTIRKPTLLCLYLFFPLLFNSFFLLYLLHPSDSFPFSSLLFSCSLFKCTCPKFNCNS